jgi:hypothetical protein
MAAKMGAPQRVHPQPLPQPRPQLLLVPMDNVERILTALLATLMALTEDAAPNMGTLSIIKSFF